MPVLPKIQYDVNFIRSNLIFGFIFSKNRSHISKNKRRLKQDSPRFIKNCYHYIPFKSSSIFSNLESEGFGNFKSTTRPFLSNNINRGIAPTRKAIIKGKQPRQKKTKYLNQFELHAVLADLKLDPIPNWDWLILLVAKTGLRFSEALGLTPDDFDFVHQTLSVNKTWNYKNGGGFVPTKNASSVRKVQLDWQLIMQLSVLLKNLPDDKPIFVNGKVYNSTANGILARHCKQAGVPVISIHGLRHTHASLLLFAGVSIASVSKRLGHASMNTTQETYLHVIRELENKDVDIVMRALSTLI